MSTEVGKEVDPTRVPIHPESLEESDKPEDKEAQAYFREGYAEQLKGDFAQALEGYKAAVEKNPMLFEGYFNMGLILRQKEQPAYAVKVFQQAAKIHPFFRPTFKNLAELYELLGHESEAKSAWAQYQQL